jgi:hypothetical protein
MRFLLFLSPITSPSCPPIVRLTEDENFRCPADFARVCFISRKYEESCFPCLCIKLAVLAICDSVVRSRIGFRMIFATAIGDKPTPLLETILATNSRLDLATPLSTKFHPHYPTTLKFALVTLGVSETRHPLPIARMRYPFP